ncbi:MAG: hypothetical protein PVI30_27110 [Myxococcales bacterium]|jgi:DNA-binding transcriptional regulator GbsR (MarR family)
MQQAVESYIPNASSHPAEARRELGALEARFIQNWAALARAFGMDPMLGRIHALTYLSDAPVTAGHVAVALGVDEAQALSWLEELAGWGVIERAHGDAPDNGPAFEADADPWSWFLVTLKERGRREFGPLVEAIREANARAAEIERDCSEISAAQRARLQRIARFTQFVEQIANLLETFAGLGAGPMMSTMRMVAKMRGPRLLRS